MSLLPMAATLATVLLLVAATVLGRFLGYRIPYRLAVPFSLLAATVVATGTGVLGQESGLRIGIVLGFATAIGLVHYLDSPHGSWATTLRTRLLMGVPWGTIVTIVFVASVYLFVQGGIEDPYSPLHIPFTSWSYFYPIGVVTSPFAHASFGHVTGNLIGTVVLAPIAEYAWSHFPTERGESSFSSWRANPYVRAFLLFPLGVVIVGLGTSIFSWGAIIGFSGVVFAFAGFAILRYPILTVVALTGRGAVNTIYYALRDPVVVGSASPSYGPPWWVGIAVQGHLLGLLLGAVLGLILVGKRRRLPSAGRLFVGVLLMGFSFTLYALWWYRTPSTYVLYRGLGVVLVVTLAALLATAMRATASEVFEGVTKRQVAIMLVILPLFTMAMVAVPLNATTLDHVDPPDDAVEIGDYHVYYAEDVTNQRVGAIDIELFNETTAVQASGVIVVSDSRHLWTEAESSGSLAFWGERAIHVGDVGWKETVRAKRIGWRVVGGNPVFFVSLKPPGGEYTRVFASNNTTARPTIDGRNVTVSPQDGEFRLVVSNNTTTLGRTTIPGQNTTTTAGGLTFVRNGTRVFATRGGTRVLVTVEEEYE